MERGIDGDYRLKDGFIRTESHVLQEIEELLSTLEEERKAISVNLQILRQDKHQNSDSSGGNSQGVSHA